jgi:hypothetical protein
MPLSALIAADHRRTQQQPPRQAKPFSFFDHDAPPAIQPIALDRDKNRLPKFASGE